ncbi:MAG: methyltransferase domain-containing protein [Desulfovibrio sp.]|jgi:SAM-dependent methyltransferase|nr:methyltransferase domain-containing protein [Desulfovibrio sp.]
MKRDWTGPELMRLSGAYWESCVLQAAVRLDLFTILSEDPLSEEELAKKLGCPVRGLSMLVTALVSLGLAEREQGRVRPAGGALPFLSRHSPEYLGFIVRHHAHILPGWARLAETVRAGTTAQEETVYFTQEAEEREAFLLGMHNIARLQAERVAGALDFSGRERLLDAGGGPGTYAAYFCRKNPGLRATIFDLPASEPFARKVIAEFGLEGRLDFLGGNFLRDPLPKGQDVVWLSQVLHGENPEDAAALVRSAGAALKPGGLICIQEFLLRDDRTGPVSPALFALNMLVQTKGGRAYTEGELRAMLTAAGAVRLRLLEEHFPGDARVLVGEKE